MAGILDVKRRVLDALITVDGRRQMANSTIDISVLKKITGWKSQLNVKLGIKKNIKNYK